MHLLKSLKHALLIQSALYKIVKNAFFTEIALIEINKKCASYSKRTAQNCKRTRSLLKVHLVKSLKHALLIQSELYKIVKKTFLLKVHLLKSLKHALLIRITLYNIVEERVLY